MKDRFIYALRARSGGTWLYLRSIQRDRRTGFETPKYTFDVGRAMLRATQDAAERNLAQAKRLTADLDLRVIKVPVVAEYRVWDYGAEDAAWALAGRHSGRSVARHGDFFLVVADPTEINVDSARP